MVEETMKHLMGTRPACRALGVSPATIYRWRRPEQAKVLKLWPVPARALSGFERATFWLSLTASAFEMPLQPRCLPRSP